MLDVLLLYLSFSVNIPSIATLGGFTGVLTMVVNIGALVTTCNMSYAGLIPS